MERVLEPGERRRVERYGNWDLWVVRLEHPAVGFSYECRAVRHAHPFESKQSFSIYTADWTAGLVELKRFLIREGVAGR